MKILSFIKRNILGFILGVIVTGIVGTVALTINSSDVGYSNSSTNKTNVQDAITELYTKCNQMGVTVLNSQAISAGTPKTTTYTFDTEVNTGLVIVTGIQNSTSTSVMVAQISSLSSGTYTSIDNKTNGFTSDKPGGARVQIYKIENVPSGATMTLSTRYVGILQVIKLK